MHKGKAYLLVLTAAFLWGTIGFFVRFLTAAGLSEAQLIAFRSWISAGIMLSWLLIRDRRELRIRLRDLWMFVGTGVISFVLFNYCYFVALQLTSLSAAAILLYTSPIFVALLSTWLFRERFTVRTALALVMAFGGCVLVSGFSGEASSAGFVPGLLSGFFYALYSIFGKYALRRYSSATVTAYTFVFASAGITPFADLPTLSAVQWTSATLTTLLVFSAASGAIAYLLYTKGLDGLPATDAAVAAILEPVVASLTGILVFHEVLRLVSLAGIALVIGAILVLSLPGSEPAGGFRKQ